MVASAQAKGRVAAGAQGGTAAVNAYDEGAQQVKANSAQAIAQMTAASQQAGAPAALTAQLNAQIAQPAQVALGNLATLGATYNANTQSESDAGNLYKLEAAQALPVINASENADLAQRLNELDASRSHSGGGGGGRGGGGVTGNLSDSEIRTRIMGLARQFREQQIGDLQHRYLVEAAAVKQQRPTGSGPGEKLTGRGSFYDPGNYVNPTVGAPNPYQVALAKLAQERANVGSQVNKLYGPGISQDAQQIALKIGIPADQAYGLFTPQDDAAYTSANQRLGLYTDPRKSVGVTGQIGDPFTVGQHGLVDTGEKLTRDQIQSSLGRKYYDWNGDGTLNSAFQKWLGAQTNSAVLNMKPDQQRQAFEADAQNQRFARPVVDDIVHNLQQAAQQGYGIEAAWSRLQSDPAFQNNQREFQLALSMAQPLFSYYAALRSRQTNPQDAAAAAYDPNASFDPTSTG